MIKDVDFHDVTIAELWLQVVPLRKGKGGARRHMRGEQTRSKNIPEALFGRARQLRKGSRPSRVAAWELCATAAPSA